MKKFLKNKIIKQSTYNNINDKFELSKYEENILKIYQKIYQMKYYVNKIIK